MTKQKASTQVPYRWMMVLDRASIRALGAVRLWPDLEVFLPLRTDCSGFVSRVILKDQLVLLRGHEVSHKHHDIRSLPAISRFDVSKDGMLIRENHDVPFREMPVTLGPTNTDRSVQAHADAHRSNQTENDRWMLLRQWIKPVLPVAQIARPVTRMPLTMEVIPEGERTMSPVELLLTTLPALSRFVLSGEVMNPMRLKVNLVALTGSGLAAVRLNHRLLNKIVRSNPDPTVKAHLDQYAPLPAVPGRHFTLKDGIALPLGQRFALGVTEKQVARMIGLQPTEVAVFETADRFHRLSEHEFMPLKRSVIRMAEFKLADSSGGDG